jgi:hypothetical protein
VFFAHTRAVVDAEFADRAKPLATGQELFPTTPFRARDPQSCGSWSATITSDADYPGMIGKGNADLRDLPPRRNLNRDHSEIGLA